MNRRGRTVVSTFLSASLLAATASGIGRAEAERASIEAVGSSRQLGAYFHHDDLPDDALAASVFRLLLEGRLPGSVRYDANLYVDLSRAPAGATGGSFSTASSFRSPYRARQLEWDFWRDGNVSAQAAVDRLRIRRAFGPVDVALGRFPVNYSVAMVFTPNDFFAPFSASAINRTFKPGVDAAQVGVNLGDWSALEVTAVLGSDAEGTPAWARSAAVARLETVAFNFQAALLGGRLAERWMVGATLQGDIEGVSVRAEGHVGFPDVEGDPHARASAGVGHTFGWRSLTIGGEYAFFSDGASSPGEYLARAQRFFPDDLPYLGRHYAGVSASAELIPILHAGVLALANLGDRSGMLSFNLSYSISNEADFVAGAIVGRGTPPSMAGDTLALASEFGATPVGVFLETRFSF